MANVKAFRMLSVIMTVTAPWRARRDKDRVSIVYTEHSLTSLSPRSITVFTSSSGSCLMKIAISIIIIIEPRDIYIYGSEDGVPIND